ncbi:hypothetical protein ACVMAJ_006841 [Bradyrhizobium sp. USDA 4448]
MMVINRSKAEIFRDGVHAQVAAMAEAALEAPARAIYWASAGCSPKEARRLVKDISAIRKWLEEVAIDAEGVARRRAKAKVA